VPHVRDAPVHLADHGGAIERDADVRVHVASGVVLAHPVVAVGADAEPRKRVDEDLRVVARVRGVPVVGLVGNVGERASHLAFDRVGRQQRLGIHRVQVIHPVQERGVVPGGAQRARDHVEDHGAAEAADVDRPRRGLRIVDDLRTGDPGRQLVGPLHGLRALAR